jgi:hypothetical protein
VDRLGRLAAAAVVAFAVAACGGDDDDAEVDSGEVEGVVIERVGEYAHVDPPVVVEYDHAAPSGGDHYFGRSWANCGVYDGEVPAVVVVHSLEHGAVWVALGPDSTAADREAAAALAEGDHRGRLVVSDVPDLPNPVELVAWGFRLELDSLDDPRAERFLDEFVNADSAPEAGALCEQGLGEPPVPPELPTEPLARR